MKRVDAGLGVSAALAALTIGLLSLVAPGRCGAQAGDSQQGSGLVASDGVGSGAPTYAMASQPPAPSEPEASAPAAAQATTAADDSDWHFAISPYLWLPGMHGIIGTDNLNANVSASPADLLSNFRFGLMGAFDSRYKRIVLPLDFMWVRLGDSKGFPNTPEELTAKVTANEVILTPKIGYRLIDSKMIKIDGLTGFRYWHVGTDLKFVNNGGQLLKVSNSLNWVDPLVGGRIGVILSPKIEALIAGDVGGWGTGSQLDYQLVGLLGYKIKPALALQVGYRYLDVNYRGGGAIFNVAMSGVVLGATLTLK
jgi:hypothetical protein